MDFLTCDCHAAPPLYAENHRFIRAQIGADVAALAVVGGEQHFTVLRNERGGDFRRFGGHGEIKSAVRGRPSGSQHSDNGKDCDYDFFHYRFLHVNMTPTTQTSSTMGASLAKINSKPCRIVPATASSGLL